MSEDTLADDLAAAWDAAEGEIDGQRETSESIENDAYQAEGADAEPDQSASDEAGIEREGQSDSGVGEGARPDVSKADAKADPGAGNANESPPVGLPPAAREVWKDTPKAMRDAIAKREKDFEAGIMKYAGQAKKGDAIDQVIAPYRQLFAMNQASPPQMINNLLQTAAVLQMGSAPQKAQMVAALVKQFGVDIQALDSALVGEEPKDDPNAQVEQILNERLQPLQQQLQQYQMRDQQIAQAQEQEVRSELQQFAANPQNEFYSDVKMDMADILDMAANRGISMSLEDAYKRACKLHPEISKIIEARSGGMQRRRQAASSVRGAPGGSESGQPGDLRSAIEQAWDRASSA